MSANHLSRKDFLKNTSLLLASGNLLSTETFSKDYPMREHQTDKMPKLFKNVRLETGFEWEEDEIAGTKTDLFLIEIQGNKIVRISPNNPNADAFDAKGRLMLPALKDMHIHLDKTYYGGPWKARSKKNRSVKDMIVLEEKLIPELLQTSTYRAEKLIELLQSHGVNFARSHVNIEPSSTLQGLKNLEKALANKQDSFTAEIVAFPQHGIFYSKSEQLMKDAAQMDIDYIGGLDPYSIDGSIEKGIDFIVDLALQYQKGIDIHLHETGDSGIKTIEYLLQKVAENPILKSKTFLSHSFALARLEQAKLQEIAEKLAHTQIGIISTIPFGGLTMPIPTLYKYGVDVRTGNDSIVDHWNTFGSGSILQKSNLMAQLYGYSTEHELSRCLKLATHNIVPLNDQGEQVWPKINDQADFILVDASCSAEAVSRISPIKSLIHQGKIVY